MTKNNSESVQMIRDSVGAVVPPGANLQRIRALRHDGTGIDRDVWKTIVDLGWLSLLLDEDSGGLGLSVLELCVIAEELGAALVPEPVLAVAAMVPLLADPIRSAVLKGSVIVVPAWREEACSPWASSQMRVSDGRISGRKILVASAAAADVFVVTTIDGPVLVERGAQGFSIELTKTQDGGYSGTLEMRDTPCAPLTGDASAAIHELSLAHSAYLLGASERAFEITLDYLRSRKQFGRFIGSFQVLQHRAAEAKIQLALSRAVLDEAVAAVTQGAPLKDQLQTAARAIARVSDTAMLIARESVQMHGAIGITDEHDIGLYCRKILSIYNQFGSAGSNRARYLATLSAKDR